MERFFKRFYLESSCLGMVKKNLCIVSRKRKMGLEMVQ